MNDIFIEQIVKKKRTMRDRLLFILVILAVILFPALLVYLGVTKIIMTYFVVIAFFLFLFGVWFVWYFRSHQNVEFEYQMVQDTLVVSKIIAKRKRKELLKLDCQNIEMLVKGDDSELNGIKLVRVVDASGDSSDEKNNYYAVYRLVGGSKRALVFRPDDRVLNAMRPYLKKDIVLKLFYNR